MKKRTTLIFLKTAAHIQTDEVLDVSKFLSETFDALVLAESSNFENSKVEVYSFAKLSSETIQKINDRVNAMDTESMEGSQRIKEQVLTELKEQGIYPLENQNAL